LQKSKRQSRKMSSGRLASSKLVGLSSHPARAWSVQTPWEVMTVCVIMHYMIVELEQDDSLFDNEWDS
jgi:hypothetical protein